MENKIKFVSEHSFNFMTDEVNTRGDTVSTVNSKIDSENRFKQKYDQIQAIGTLYRYILGQKRNAAY